MELNKLCSDNKMPPDIDKEAVEYINIVMIWRD